MILNATASQCWAATAFLGTRNTLPIRFIRYTFVAVAVVDDVCHPHKRENTIHFCYSLDFNYYGSWKVIETMDQTLVEWMEWNGTVCLLGAWVGRWIGAWNGTHTHTHTATRSKCEAFRQSNLRHRWMKNFNKIQWLQSTWNTSKCTFKWFWFEPDWYLVSRAKEYAWMCHTRIQWMNEWRHCTAPIHPFDIHPNTHTCLPSASNARDTLPDSNWNLDINQSTNSTTSASFPLCFTRIHRRKAVIWICERTRWTLLPSHILYYQTVFFLRWRKSTNIHRLQNGNFSLLWIFFYGYVCVCVISHAVNVNLVQSILMHSH